MDYSQLSDFEINGMVASLTQSPGDHTQTSNETFIHEYADIGEIKSLCIGWKKFDPCNNPADAWPIIVHGRIGLNFVNGNWRAQSLKTGYVEFCHENPLRAAMIVFLMMQESQHA
ncbi:phage protein NinX family protein [Cronobacter dublinensis]|uniref:phage protein NinX family protein n=1 Tax=Cronobacter dublinensis TaxID=413497 RepID=UPI000CFCF6D7|nr:phage protein NinX family protein [Cronobacter dublinensis]